MNVKALLINLCNKIVFLVLVGFIAQQLIINSLLRDGFSVSQIISSGIAKDINNRKQSKVSPSKGIANNQDKLEAEIDLIDFKLMAILNNTEQLDNNDIEKLDKIFSDLEKIKDDAEQKKIAGLINERVERLEKQIKICKQSAEPSK